MDDNNKGNNNSKTTGNSKCCNNASNNTCNAASAASATSSTSSNSTTSVGNEVSITNDLAYDGMWSFAAFSGMMIKLAQDFVKEQQQQQQQLQREHSNSGGNDDDDDDDDDADNEKEEDEENYIYFNINRLLGPSSDNDYDNNDEESMMIINNMECLQEKLNERNLHLADGVLRRLVERCCPSRVPIRRLDEEITMKQIMEYKLKGNNHFLRHEFREAIDYYNDALSCIHCERGEHLHLQHLFVAPIHQIQQIVNVLSNKAECLLRKYKYEDAAEVATEALIFMNDHVKSRIRRAKATMEIGKYDRYELSSRGGNNNDGNTSTRYTCMDGVAYLIQAKYDLDEVLLILENNQHESTLTYSTSTTTKITEGNKQTLGQEVLILLSEVNRLLKNAKKKVLLLYNKTPDKNNMMMTNTNNNNNNEWDLNVLKIKSRCW